MQQCGMWRARSRAVTAVRPARGCMDHALVLSLHSGLPLPMAKLTAWQTHPAVLAQPGVVTLSLSRVPDWLLRFHVLLASYPNGQSNSQSRFKGSKIQAANTWPGFCLPSRLISHVSPPHSTPTCFPVQVPPQALCTSCFPIFFFFFFFFFFLFAFF